MAARRASGGDDVGRQERVAAAVDPHRLALQRDAQVTRFAVRPVEHSLLAVDAQPDVVLAAGGRLRHSECAARAAVEFDQRRHVVDDLAAGKERAHVRDHAGDVEIRGKARKVLRVAADRAHHQRQAAALRVEDPAEAVVLRAVLDARREAALDVFDLHQPDRGPASPSRTSVRA